MKQATAVAAIELIGIIYEAAKKDWKAAAYLAERNPEIKAQFDKRNTGTGGTLNVQFKFERKIPGVTIDGETEEIKAIEHDAATPLATNVVAASADEV